MRDPEKPASRDREACLEEPKKDPAVGKIEVTQQP